MLKIDVCDKPVDAITLANSIVLAMNLDSIWALRTEVVQAFVSPVLANYGRYIAG